MNRKSVCFYFQVHQPFRMRKYSIFDINNSSDYFDEKKNREIMEKVAHKCYLPMNKLVLELIKKHKGNFKVAYSLSGVFIEQAEKYAPKVIESFKELAKTGCVEFLSETYYHSLSYLYSKEEFREQIAMHSAKIKGLFGHEPKVFRNTELITNNELAKYVHDLGYKAIIAEGADRILEWKSPNHVYRNSYAKNMKMLLKNYKLSDDIAFRFGNRHWKEYPLTADKFAAWCDAADGETINLFMDYETFGEHQWEDTGIFDFMMHLPDELLKRGIGFRIPSETAELDAKGDIDMHDFVSWADVERDLSAWLGNRMQHSAINRLYSMKEKIMKSGDNEIIDAWRKLTTSDHFYYMCTKWFNDGDVHKYFNHYDSPYDSFINFINVLNDITLRLESAETAHTKNQMYHGASSKPNSVDLGLYY